MILPSLFETIKKDFATKMHEMTVARYGYMNLLTFSRKWLIQASVNEPSIAHNQILNHIYTHPRKTS